MNNTKFRVGIEGTIFAALAIVLSFIPTKIGPSITISLGTIPMILFVLRRGAKAGVMAGFLWGILHFLVGTAYILSPIQGFIEYVIAYAFIGVGGLFASSLKKAVKQKEKTKVIRYVLLGSVFGTLARFFWHFVAGYFFWGQYAPKGMGALLYSFITNGLSGLLTAAITGFVLVLLTNTTPRLFRLE